MHGADMEGWPQEESEDFADSFLREVARTQVPPRLPRLQERLGGPQATSRPRSRSCRRR
jgi:hypothetical protein